MYGGKLQHITFMYYGSDVDSVLDRLPTSRLLDGKDGAMKISAEVFGSGIDMWLRSQGDNVYSLTKWLAVSLMSCAGFWSLKATIHRTKSVRIFILNNGI